ncbi:unnamed protein product [Brassica rapa subsp. trilocularis]
MQLIIKYIFCVLCKKKPLQRRQRKPLRKSFLGRLGSSKPQKRTKENNFLF